jgi:hypothetical protein
MPVNTPRQEYLDIQPVWERLRNTFTGRDAIIDAGTKYTPALPGATAEQNKAYLTRGNFFNAVARTTHGLVGAIFQKSPEIDIRETYKYWLDDITLTNVTFNMFALDALHDVMLMGRYGILVEMATESTGRPYMIGYRTENVINWRTDRIEGDELLTMVVLKETIDEPKEDDTFVEEDLIQYRVLRLDIDGENRRYVQQLWRQQDGEGDFIPYGEELIPIRRGSPLRFLPFVFLGPWHSTPRVEKPPLQDLADVNLGHWRNSCDHEQGLHLVALPTPYVSGMRTSSTDDEADRLKIGPSVVWQLDAQGSAGMLEFTGAGLKSIVTAMEEKKQQMATLGARVLEMQPAHAETATAITIRHAGEYASLRTMAQAGEQGLTMALQIAVWWYSTEENPSDVPVAVVLNKDFVSVKAKPEEVKTALLAMQSGDISFETFWHLLTEGGWTREGVTADEERKQIEFETTDKDKLDVGVIEADDDATYEEGSDLEGGTTEADLMDDEN